MPLALSTGYTSTLAGRSMELRACSGMNPRPGSTESGPMRSVQSQRCAATWSFGWAVAQRWGHAAVQSHIWAAMWSQGATTHNPVHIHIIAYSCLQLCAAMRTWLYAYPQLCATALPELHAAALPWLHTSACLCLHATLMWLYAVTPPQDPYCYLAPESDPTQGLE